MKCEGSTLELRHGTLGGRDAPATNYAFVQFFRRTATELLEPLHRTFAVEGVSIEQPHLFHGRHLDAPALRGGRTLRQRTRRNWRVPVTPSVTLVDQKVELAEVRQRAQPRPCDRGTAI